MVREEFGRAAGRQIVIEKRLEGEELSFLALVAGRTDHAAAADAGPQAAFDGDTGPEHRRHGRYSPGAARHAGIARRHAKQKVLVPTVHAMKRGRTAVPRHRSTPAS